MQYNVNNTTKTLQVCKQHQIASGNILVNKPITCLALVTMKACVHITNNTTLSVQVCKKKTTNSLRQYYLQFEIPALQLAHISN